MIERALIHIAGPSKAGKTSLVAHLLRSVGRLEAAARCIRDDRLRRPRESAPKGHAELQAYRAAGADPVALYRFPASHADWEEFSATILMEDYFEALFLEGDRPVEWVDLSVFVAPPIADEEPFLVRAWRDRARERAAQIEAIEKLLARPNGLEAYFAAIVGLPLGNLIVKNREVTEKLQNDLHAVIDKLREAPPPAPTEHWAIAKGYEGIERAQVVIVNVRGGQQNRAEPLLRDLRRLRADEEVFKDVVGLH